MNISNKIWEAAEKLGLDYIPTGGGFDYVWREVGKGQNRMGDGRGVDLVLASQEDFACSPDTLSEPSVVAIYVNDPDWHEGTFVYFKTAREAMKFMAGVQDCWKNGVAKEQEATR